MIDTICLLIPNNKITNINSFNWELQSRTNQYEKFVRNPSSSEKDAGQYFPRLTNYKRRFNRDQNIRIEFSVPKLIFMNNLDELEDKDFPQVIDVLRERLEIMGVMIAKQELENASVSSVHFSKNIVLQDGYTANHLISEMNKVNLKKSFDFAKTRFINDGQSLYAHTNSHQLVIYDKIADLNKGVKRAIDKDQTPYQRSMFSEISKKKDFLEIIRFEIRLNQKQKMNKVLSDLGYKANPIFRQVFSEKLSQAVVISYWKKVIRDYNIGAFALSTSPKDILPKLFIADKSLKPKQAIYLLGLLISAKEDRGMRQLRDILSKRSHDRTWHRIAKDVKSASELIFGGNMKNWVTQLDRQFEAYQPYRQNKVSIN